MQTIKLSPSGESCLPPSKLSIFGESMSFFDSTVALPVDPILGLEEAFRKDKRSSKVNLGAGIYQNADLVAAPLICIQQAEQEVLREDRAARYLPIQGWAPFLEAVQGWIFGAKTHPRLIACQTLGGTGALRVAGECFASLVGKKAYIPDPTWDNHKRILTRAGLEVEYYPYYSHLHHSIAFEKMENFLATLPANSLILLHGGCHNPTGADLSSQQWHTVASLCKKHQLFPLIDMAYQGFGVGFYEDLAPIRCLLEKDVEFALAYSLSKNMGLYSERVGALFFHLQEEKITEKVASHLRATVRGNYSSPPSFGARIATRVLTRPDLTLRWEKEVATMRDRLQSMREQLSLQLARHLERKDFSFLQQQRGMFSFFGLTQDHVKTLIEEFGIYLPSNGRINIAGLNAANLTYVVDAIAAVSKP